MPQAHKPVLYKEIIHAIHPKSGGRYIDGTLGAGGHAYGILEASAPDGQLLGLDVDPLALDLSRRRLACFGERACIRQGSHSDLKDHLSAIGWDLVDGIVLDLGASSMQFDTPERGFSFLQEGPLDMRFTPANPLTASEIVNQWEQAELMEILYRYGEEPAARQIARAIVAARPITGTLALATIVEQVVPRRGPHHPATRVFQALRMAVNGELQAVEATLPQAMQALTKGGRLAVISFHSLEDRMVKEYFHRESRNCLCPSKQPICTCGHQAIISLPHRRPITPSEEELKENKRSRSAKLRTAQKL